MNLLNSIEFPNLFSGDLRIERVAFSVFGIDVYWYGIIIAIAMIAGLLIAMVLLKRRNMKTDYAIEMFIIVVLLTQAALKTPVPSTR